MQPEDGRLALARRLRGLRRERRLRQVDVADALGVSAPLISSWEKNRDPVIPDVDHLVNYARFFSAYGEDRDALNRELIRLREGALGLVESSETGSMWRFSDGAGITIVCGEVPTDAVRRTAYTDPGSPDYIELYNYADPDSLIELYGHIRALNPLAAVRYCTAGNLTSGRYQDHLVFLGGVDWNSALADVLMRINIPIRQMGRAVESDSGGFRLVGNGASEVFSPSLITGDDGPLLVEDVGHFVRGVNPYSPTTTITICNGSYGRGVLGAVRVSTDPVLGERNTKYLLSRLSGKSMFSIVMRVVIANGVTVTPDLTVPETRLHEWSR